MASPAMAPVQDDDDDQYGEISFSPAAVGVQLKDQLSSGNDYAPKVSNFVLFVNITASSTT
ncbi:hypothetical protein RchiOBHm_Chr5g0036391 [Rosa chinensis]|uniref:Uncharacterized protein n=1 Tax=Rosa chinensis TaxID=74649 RepID=A0A2P6QBG5_ROSCH|nr:hypothetical protein RchiOBHm_Chr5g0036391 [Rosa chinensis]